MLFVVFLIFTFFCFVCSVLLADFFFPIVIFFFSFIHYLFLLIYLFCFVLCAAFCLLIEFALFAGKTELGAGFKYGYSYFLAVLAFILTLVAGALMMKHSRTAANS